MKISYEWLRRLISVTADTGEIARRLTACGLEVEATETWERVRGNLSGVIVAEVVECQPHPNADRLKVCKVNTGAGEQVPVVCGAANVAAGQKVLLAQVGSVLYPIEGEPIKISKAKIRGELSEGMICAEDELGLGDSHEGILVLPVEAQVGLPASEYFQLPTDTLFEIGLTPNRADAASHLGVARDLAALYRDDEHVRWQPSEPEPQIPDTAPLIGVKIDNPEACLRYSSIVLGDIQVGPSPDWISDSLRAIGLKPVNNVVDITNYVLHELGQPLHAFDADKMGAELIHVGNLPPGTLFTALDQVERKLDGSELMIHNGKDALCMAGVMGGLQSSVDYKTSRVFLESACFLPRSVRRSARKHGLHSDSSFRFERGTDPEMCVKALRRTVQLMITYCSARPLCGVLDLYPQPVAPAIVHLSEKYLSGITGINIPIAELKSILISLQMEILSEREGILEVKVPTSKVDVTRPADLAEEVLRIYGYDKIPLNSKMSFSPERLDRFSNEVLRQRISEWLLSQGFNEILTNSLTPSSSSDFIYNGQDLRVKVLNPLSNDLDVLRPEAVLGGLPSLVYNMNRRQNVIRFFEFSTEYLKISNTYIENQVCVLWYSGASSIQHWRKSAGEMDFYAVKADAFSLLGSLGLDEMNFDWSAHTDPVLTNAAECRAGDKVVMRTGNVRKSVLNKFDITQQVNVLKINLAELTDLLRHSGFSYREPPRFPEVRRDISMIVDHSTQWKTISQIVMKTDRRLIRNLNLFDVYEGDKIGEGKKSLALSITLCDEEATLQDKKIDAVLNKVMDNLEKEAGAVIRRQ